MSKEMTPKEALEKISWRYPNDPSFQEWCNTIKQALERLEILEQEHANALQVIKILTDENKAQEMKKKVGWF